MDNAQIIKITEDYSACLNDNMNKDKTEQNYRSPKGAVEIYDENNKLLRKSNLVLYQGREILMQHMMGIEDSNITDCTNIINLKIC
jgi:hypothetical protein